ncbi:conjugal transfer protein TraG [Synergistales bacterium]|nr:conjugal transfer protein TraG [Synergistales bacterium]
MVRGYPIYGFWKSITWLLQLGKVYSQNKIADRIVSTSGFIIGITMVLGAVLMRLILRKDGVGAESTLHGTAHWATKAEIIEAGLLNNSGEENKEGVVVGGWLAKENNLKSLKTLRHNGPEHILVFAPTRSGKGVGLVLPTLLGEWQASTLVLDIKGENYALSSGYRKSIGQDVYRFNPADPDAAEKGTSVTFNPLEEIELDYKKIDGKIVQVHKGETAEIQNLASIMADPEGKGLADHWMKTGHALIVGTITHLMYVGLNNDYCPCLADVANELSKPGVSWEDNIKGWQTYPHLGYNEHNEPIPHPVAATAAQEMLNRDPKESSSVLSTAISFLTLYRDPVIAANTQVSSFTIKGLMNSERPVNLYLVINPTDLARLQPFIRLFVTQVVNKLVPEMTFASGKSVKSYKHRLLLLLDEFPSLGKLPIFEKAIAFIAGYGLKAYLITQDVSQLYGAYGKEESISSNCHIQIAYSPNKPDTADLVSKMTGTTTIVKESISESGKRTDLFHNQTSVSMQEYSRSLLTPDECRRLPGPKKDFVTGDILIPGDMLIFPSGFPPVYGKQKLFFMDKTLLSRSQISKPEFSDHAIDMKAKQEYVTGKKLLIAQRECEEKRKKEEREREAERREEEDIKMHRAEMLQSRQRGMPPHKLKPGG